MAWHFFWGVVVLGAVFAVVTEVSDWVDEAEDRGPVETGLITTMGLAAERKIFIYQKCSEQESNC